LIIGLSPSISTFTGVCLLGVSRLLAGDVTQRFVDGQSIVPDRESKNPQSLCPVWAIGGNFDRAVLDDDFSIVEVFGPVVVEGRMLHADGVHVSPLRSPEVGESDYLLRPDSPIHD
jgi:hypothetical protein